VLELVLKAISRYNMLAAHGTKSARVIAAVSGGADSVCLLHALRELDVPLAGVAHLNHKLRGDASDQDEKFVKRLAAQFHLPFYRAEARVIEAGGNLEQEARRARREFFAGLMRENAGDRIALGHTRDDQAETVLFRIVRGSGLAGLAGIHPKTADGFIRPLIEVTHVQIEQHLTGRGIPWREDATNRDARFARNRIRHHLLPQLAREWNPRIVDALAQLGDLAFEEESWWSANLPSILTVADGGVESLESDLAALPRAVARRVIRHAISLVKGDLRGVEFTHIDGIIDGRDSGVRGVKLARSFGWLRIAPASTIPKIDPIPVRIPGTYSVSGESSPIRLENDEIPGTSCANLKAELTGPLVLRGWRPGDHYRAVGQSRDQKLKDMFQSARIPSWRRAAWPILECGDKILWAREFGVAEEFAARGRTGPVIRVFDLMVSR
jgi:tRNA(Ile)-lysidine synthase